MPNEQKIPDPTCHAPVLDQNQAMPLIAIMGPTACGKTQLSIDLAQALNGEVISVDSALVYKGMDIGTAKPTLSERCGVPHHLIDVRDPAQAYSAADFACDAKALIKDILDRGKYPILVGGTVLYFKALLEGMADMPASNEHTRNQLLTQLNEQGAQALHDRLTQVDPTAAERIHPNDPQRILRALEVYELTGKTLTQFHVEQKASASKFRVHKMGLLPSDRAVHRGLVEKRFLDMMNTGFMDEVRALYQRGDLRLDMPSMRSVGYRQAWLHLIGEYTYEEMIERAVIATRQLAKRQMTWLRKEPNLHTYDALNIDSALIWQDLKTHFLSC